ncbi:MAG: glycosyltransferase family protein [Candidatus Omnitrophica bacterium]|nr:glycosyltransferase family protein [Candidatus Omnitrophota bacterium]
MTVKNKNTANDLSDYGIIIQCRTGSTRFPRKVLEDICGQPMLLRQLKRLQKLSGIPKLVAATSESPQDDAIEHLCRDNGFICFRGPLDDVMNRFILCARKFGIKYIVRVGGDDPLIDPECCKHLVSLHRAEPHDFMYASNREGWPYGCAAELISVKALENIHSKTADPLYLEHTIPYFFSPKNEFSVFKVKAPAHINRPDYYFTVDYPEDLRLVRAVFERLKAEGDFFPFKKVIELVDREKGLTNINKHLHTGFDK